MHSYDAMELRELREEVQHLRVLLSDESSLRVALLKNNNELLEETQRQRDYIKEFRDKVVHLEDLLARVYNELGDPTGNNWGDCLFEDRDLLEYLRNDIGAEMGWDE